MPVRSWCAWNARRIEAKRADPDFLPPVAAAAATSVIWLKDPTAVKSGKLWQNNWLAIVTTSIVAFLFLLTFVSMRQMFHRLFTPSPAMASLTLKTSKGRSLAQVPEFYVGSEPGAADASGFRRRNEGGGLADAAAAAAGMPVRATHHSDERSGLLSAAGSRPQ